MPRYDLNVWDWAGHESSYTRREQWRIDVYECDEQWNHYDTPEKIIYINQAQAEMLTLGKSPDDGGDYDWDTDFWIDPLQFLETYRNIPRKVRRYLEQLEYSN